MQENPNKIHAMIPYEDDPMYPFFEVDGNLWYVLKGKRVDNIRQACVGIPRVIRKIDSSPIEYLVDVGCGTFVPVTAYQLFAARLARILINNGLIPLDHKAPFGTYFGKYVANMDSKDVLPNARHKK